MLVRDLLISSVHWTLDGSLVFHGRSVADIKGELEQMFDDPLLAASMVKDHEQTVSALYATFAKNKKPGRKPCLPDPDVLAPEVVSMQKELDSVPLKSWKCVLQLFNA